MPSAQPAAAAKQGEGHVASMNLKRTIRKSSVPTSLEEQLIDAATHNNVTGVQQLLKQGANVNWQDPDVRHPRRLHTRRDPR